MRFQHTERHSALLYGVRTLRLEAAACAAEGQTRKAAEALCAAVRLQRAIENEPREESQRSRIEIMNFATEELWRLLPYVEFSEDDLARLQREIDSIEFHSSCRLALLSDRVAGIAILDDPQSFGVPRNVARATRPFRAADEEFYLGVMADYIAAAELPFPELLARTEAVTRIVEQDSSMSHVLSRMLLSPEQGIARYTCRTELQRRMLVLALALERYRRRNGHAAPDLAALVPEYLADVPTDPTSGKAFEYKSQPDGAGYVLFSPTQKFSLPTGDKLDAETGANPLLVFRYPPLAETAPDGADEEARTESVTEQ